MKKTGETLQSLLDKYRNNPYELSTYVTTLLSECNKDALKANHKAIKQHWASFFSKETQVRLKYIYHTSKPYAKGFMAFAKNYIVNFSIPKLSEEDKAYILSSPPANELNAFIWRKYDIDVSQIN